MKRKTAWHSSRMARLWEYMRTQWSSLLVGLLALMVVDAVQLLTPRIIRDVVDGIAAGASPKLLRTAFLQILLIASGIVLFRFSWRYFIYGSSRRIEKEMRERLYGHFLRLPLSFYDRSKVGDLMAHVTNDLTAIRESIGSALVMATDAAVWSGATVAMMLLIDVRLTLLSLIPMLLIAPLARYMGGTIHRRFRAIQESFSRLSDRAQETISGIMTLKVFGREPAAVGRYTEESERYFLRNLALARVSAAQMPAVTLIASVSSVFLLWLGGRDAIFGRLSLGEFVALNAYLGMLAWPMMAMGWVVNLFQRGMASLDRVEELLSEPPEPSQAPVLAFRPARRDAGNIPAPLVYRNLSFSYTEQGPLVLDGIHLEIPAGARVAIVGRTGSGKSTLFALASRLYPPPRHTVFLDRRDVLEYQADELRSLISIVPQESFLFSESIRENIRCGLDGVPEEEIRAVARLVMMEEEILAMPQGFETVVGERGVTLSGGQRQRVALARALLRKAPILVLDDALSMVDAETEKTILANLAPLFEGRTVVVVTHRLSATADFPWVAVMDRGRIVEEGTHTDLMKRQGVYARMHELFQIEQELFATSHLKTRASCHSGDARHPKNPAF